MANRKWAVGDMSSISCRFFVVMGVSGCGKSTVGAALANMLQKHDASAVFLDADDFHPRSNIEKMSAGLPLTDDDRLPWLDAVASAMSKNKGLVIAACSCLKRSYRQRLLQSTGSVIFFIHLNGTPDMVLQRMNRRKKHFMPSRLLQSQFDDLEEPSAPEKFIAIGTTTSVDEIVLEIYSHVLSISAIGPS